MYAIIVYDVVQDRVNNVCQFLRQYLNWIQNSVFEGEISESNIEKIKQKLKSMIKKDEDSVIFYVLSNRKLVEKDIMGLEKNMTSNVI